MIGRPLGLLLVALAAAGAARAQPAPVTPLDHLPALKGGHVRLDSAILSRGFFGLDRPRAASPE